MIAVQEELQFVAAPVWEFPWSYAFDFRPEVGAFCQVDTTLARKQGGGTQYAYMERCRIIEALPGGEWLAEIAMGFASWCDQGMKRWPKDGMRLILSIEEMWPVTHWRGTDLQPSGRAG